MRISRVVLTAAALAAAGCGAGGNCAYSGRVATAAPAGSSGTGWTEFPCPGYGPANRCRIVPSPNPRNRGLTNMQPGNEHVRGINPVLPYSTDDNPPTLPYDTGDAHGTSGPGGWSPVGPRP
ncbi:MAG TPA: hypothetical protein VEK07_25835 [Polyangiaceae bacterium]|nr:hypothetical protein [Polyangiaceae bacterium]